MIYDELLPYLLKLNQTKDVRSFVSLNWISQDPIIEYHKQFLIFEDIIDKWQVFTSRFLWEKPQDYSSGEDTSCAVPSYELMHK